MNQPFQRQQYADDAAENDDRTDHAALTVTERQIAFGHGAEGSDLFTDCGGLDQKCQQRSAQRIHGKFDDFAFGSVLHGLCRAHVPTRRLPREFDNGLRIRIPLQVLTFPQQRERTDAHDVGIDLVPRQFRYGAGELDDLA